MSIPLIQKPEKDDINTSIIAIKRNIERINMLLGLVDNDSPDLSGFATKQELQDAVTELQPVDEVTVGNMHSVTSNSVAETVGWQFIKSETGAVDIAIDFSKYREILIVATPWANEYNAYNTSMVIPTHYLLNYNNGSTNSYVMGYGGTLNNPSVPYGGRIDIRISTNKITLFYSYYDNTDRTSLTRLAVYAR